MHVNQKVLIHNKFDILIHDVNTGELVGQFESYNIVLDQMWTRLCGGSSYFVNIHFGTGDGTLSAARTSLFTHLGTKAAADEEQVKALPVSRWKRKIVLNPEEFVGATITEVGIAFGATASNLVTHSKLKDAEGNPISLPAKTDTQVITIYATVFVTINNVAGINMLGMPSSNQLVNYLVGGASAPTGAIYLTAAKKMGVSIGNSATLTWSPDTVNKKRKTNVVRFDINTGNGDVIAMGLSNLFEALFPITGIFDGQPYSNVPLGTGDDTNNVFSIPSKNVKLDTINIKVNGAVTTFNSKEIIKSPAAKSKELSTGDLPYCVGISKNGKRLAVKNGASPYMHFWNMDTGIKETAPTAVTANGRISLNFDGTVVVTSYPASPYHDVWRLISGTWIKETIPTGVALSEIILNDEGSRIYEFTSGSALRVYDYINNVWERNISLEISLPGNVVAVSESRNSFIVKKSTTPFFEVYDFVDGSAVKRIDPGAGLPPSAITSFGISDDGSAVACNIGTTVYVFYWDESSWVESISFIAAFIPTVILPLDEGNALALIDGNSTSNSHKLYKKSNNSFALDGILLPDTLPYPATFNCWAYNKNDNLLFLNSNNSSSKIFSYEIDKDGVDVDLITVPINGAVVSADYTVDGVHKTNQFVIDTSFALQFGEGV